MTRTHGNEDIERSGHQEDRALATMLIDALVHAAARIKGSDDVRC
jgi:hypothetical protein